MRTGREDLFSHGSREAVLAAVCRVLGVAESYPDLVGQDVESAAFATTRDGRAVRLADLMPTDEEVAAATADAVDAADFPEAFRQAQPELMRGVSRGVVKKNTASRKIVRRTLWI